MNESTEYDIPEPLTCADCERASVVVTERWRLPPLCPRCYDERRAMAEDDRRKLRLEEREIERHG